MTHIRRHSPGQLVFCFICGGCLALTLYYSDYAIEYMSAGLLLCVRTVIPSLFPFMVISGLMVSVGLGEMIGRACEGPVRRLFGVSGASACALFMGAVCGFPIGARTVVALLDAGHISRREAERLMCFCNNPSSAFLISAVGVSLYANRRAGLVFYLVTLSSALILGVGARILFGRVDSRSVVSRPERPPVPGLDSFTGAVSDAATGMLTVCAYVVFFSAIMGCLGRLVTQLGCPAALGALLYGAVELSGGVSASAALGTGPLGVCLTAFIIGWSGLSVHFQIMSLCRGRGLCFRGYFVAKMCQGTLNALIIAGLYALFPRLFVPQDDSAAVVISPAVIRPIGAVVLVIFICALALSVVRNTKRDRRARSIHKSTTHVIY